MAELLGVQISFKGFFGDPFFVNPSKLICTPNMSFLLEVYFQQGLLR